MTAIPTAAYMCSPEMSIQTGTHTYTAPDDASLDPDTDYFLYFEDTDVSAPHHDFFVSSYQEQQQSCGGGDRMVPQEQVTRDSTKILGSNEVRAFNPELS